MVVVKITLRANVAYYYRSGDLSLFGPLCREPLASKSPLARQAFLLLENQHYSDLEFLLPPDSEASQAGHVVKAHRVILAARCRWFHRALLSGMREAIDRYVSSFPFKYLHFNM